VWKPRRLESPSEIIRSSSARRAGVTGSGRSGVGQHQKWAIPSRLKRPAPEHSGSPERLGGNEAPARGRCKLVRPSPCGT
jgi:hypothetical protein